MFILSQFLGMTSPGPCEAINGNPRSGSSSRGSAGNGPLPSSWAIYGQNSLLAATGLMAALSSRPAMGGGSSVSPLTRVSLTSRNIITGVTSLPHSVCKKRVPGPAHAQGGDGHECQEAGAPGPPTVPGQGLCVRYLMWSSPEPREVNTAIISKQQMRERHRPWRNSR